MSLATAKIPWLDLQGLPPVADCGLLYTLAFRVGGITAASGNARSDPLTDTGDPGLADQGVAAIVDPPPGTAWAATPSMRRRAENGFTLIEVLLATALFVVVAFAGFEVLRQLRFGANLLAQRADAAAQLSAAAGALRSAALSSAAVWKPASPCGDAVEFMQRDASGTTFLLYTARGSQLVRATAPGPMDPCAGTLNLQTVVPAILGFTVTRVPAASLPAHADPVSGDADGGAFVPGGITGIAVDSHVTDVDGSQILTGNDVVEVAIDADPALTVVDLLAGSRPSAYTQTLAFTCDGRCEANGPFPEIRGAAFDDCAAGYDFQNSPAYEAPASYGYVDAGGGNRRIVVTSYRITGGYSVHVRRPGAGDGRTHVAGRGLAAGGLAARGNDRRSRTRRRYEQRRRRTRRGATRARSRRAGRVRRRTDGLCRHARRPDVPRLNAVSNGGHSLLGSSFRMALLVCGSVLALALLPSLARIAGRIAARGG